MAFKHNSFSALVSTDPEAAFERLRLLFTESKGNVKKVAEALGVNRATVFRWLARLEHLGDPRGGARGLPGRRASKD